MRVITGRIAHESNCHVPKHMKTTLKKWKRGIIPPEYWFDTYRGKRVAQSAFIDVAEKEGIELIPTIDGRPRVLPTEGACWRPLDADLFEYLVGELIKGIKEAGKIDGVLLSGHGAGCSENFPDMPGELYRRVRELIGPKIPLVVTTDSHANFSKQMVDNVDVFVGYDTYPHIDQYERANEATKIISQMIQGEIKPTMAMARPNMMPAVIACQSELYPMKYLYDMAHEIEDDGSAITITVTGGYAYADKPEMGIAILVATDNDKEQAQKYADKMAGWAWRHRMEFLSKLMSPEDAVREAIEEPEGPVVMGDPGDSLGGGGPGDGTVLLSELIKQKAKDALIGCIRDPEAVAKAVDEGLGKRVTMRLGGKITNFVGEPLKITGYVKTISDGKFISTGPMGSNLEINMGQTVVLDVDGIDVVITELPYSPNQWPWKTLDIEAEKKKIVCLKSAAHYKAVWKPFAKKFIDPDTPGPHGSNLGGFRYIHLKRPIFPLDIDLLGVAELKKTVYKNIVLPSCYEK